MVLSASAYRNVIMFYASSSSLQQNLNHILCHIGGLILHNISPIISLFTTEYSCFCFQVLLLENKNLFRISGPHFTLNYLFWEFSPSSYFCFHLSNKLKIDLWGLQQSATSDYPKSLISSTFGFLLHFNDDLNLGKKIEIDG